MEKVITINKSKSIIYFKDDFNIDERRIRSSLSSYDYEKGIPYAISRESQYKLVTSKISIKPRKYNIRYDYSSTKEISSFDTNVLLKHADAVFPNLLIGTLDNNILLNTFVFYGHKEQDIESLLSNLHEYIVSYNIPERGRINLSMYLKKGTFMSLNVRDSRINLLGNYKVDYLDGIRLDGDYVNIDIFTKLLYSFYSQYRIKQGYYYKIN